MQTLPPQLRDRLEVADTGCWLWTGGLDTYGYGQVKHAGRVRLVHRLVWTLLRGEPPADTEFDHLCRVRNCANPTHLDPVTHRENVLRGEGIGAIAAKATHCPQGHPYEGRNLVVFADGKRRCRICRNERDKDWKKRDRRRRSDDPRPVGDGRQDV